MLWIEILRLCISGGILAHASHPLPNSPSIIHFDDAETFSYNDIPDHYYSYDLQSITLHEIGHTLGLSHDDSEESVMFPYYKKQLTLGKNDIRRIQKLYR